MKSHALPLLAILTLSAPAMSEPVPQGEPEQLGLSSDRPQTADEQPARTPAQLIAEDFQILAQDHATAGLATSKRDR
jgi:hypothetical protein